MKKQAGKGRKSRWASMGKSALLNGLSNDGKRRLTRRLLLSLGVFTLVWITFFDSHSLVKRISWHHEYAELRAENELLIAEIERLEIEVAKGLSDETVEKIAREHYGMRRPGETVYRVKTID